VPFFRCVIFSNLIAKDGISEEKKSFLKGVGAVRHSLASRILGRQSCHHEGAQQRPTYPLSNRAGRLLSNGGSFHPTGACVGWVLNSDLKPQGA
jgi:hypothetical protein